ncbi:MAG TPA: hypothetical protein VFW46_06390 [Stellaceae bacterium]|jgi:cell division septal protein FtsQ|nr:hypothetical protein [Stellaceae bacterium]
MADSRQFVRQWNREIEEQRRREGERRGPQPWRIVSWLALWLLWLVGLVLLLQLFRPLQW